MNEKTHEGKGSERETRKKRVKELDVKEEVELNMGRKMEGDRRVT